MYSTPEDVIHLTGVQPRDLGLQEKADPVEALHAVLSVWCERISSAVDSRLRGAVGVDDARYGGVSDVVTRTVAMLVSVARQQRASPVVQVHEFAVQVLNTADVTRELDDELRAYRRPTIELFTSVAPETEEE